MSTAGLDIPAFVRLQALTGLVPDAFWSTWSVLGLGLSCALLAALASDKRMGPITTMLWSLVIGGLALQVFKHLWVVARPPAVLAADLIHVIGPRLRAGSMPSGHSAMLAALACALAVELRTRSLALAFVCLLLGAVGCLARIAVGVHWPSDVLVGAGVGVLSVLGAGLIETRWSLRVWLSSRRGRRLFALVQLVAGVALLSMNTGYPFTLAVQWLLGVASIVSAGWRWYGASAAPSAAVPDSAG